MTKSRQRLTKSSKGRADLVIGWSRTDGDTRQDHGGGIADTLLQLGLAVWALKPLVDGFARFGLRKPRMEFGAARGVIEKVMSRRSILMKDSWVSDAWS